MDPVSALPLDGSGKAHYKPFPMNKTILIVVRMRAAGVAT